MVQGTWTDVDAYIAEQMIPADAALGAALEASTAAGLPAIAVSPPQGKMLNILARATGAKSILEIGTLGGYSTIWLARALPAGGRLVTLECDPRHAEVAAANIARAGLADRVDIRIGRAIDTLPTLAGPFDFIFIDADKQSIPEYFEWAVKLTEPGALIIVDNVIRNGAVADSTSTDAMVLGVRRFNALVARDPRVTGTTIQTVGGKGYDGLCFLLRV
ncbi:MAG: O-methyltransferase [Gemmatimonadetes bacterium]|nr:O-methyltransferase [Gemmatimonadota bacterium]